MDSLETREIFLRAIESAGAREEVKGPLGLVTSDDAGEDTPHKIRNSWLSCYAQLYGGGYQRGTCSSRFNKSGDINAAMTSGSTAANAHRQRAKWQGQAVF